MSDAFVKGFGMDWLTITKHIDADYYPTDGQTNQIWALGWALIVSGELGLPDHELMPTSQVANYENCFVQKVTGVIINIPNRMGYQGIRVILSGTACWKIGDQREFVANVLKMGWKVTRIDWCIDVVNCNETAKSQLEKYMKVKPSIPNALKEGWASSDSDTMELGARSSALWSKVYEKGKHEKTGEDWLRLEMEFKEGYAMFVANSFSQGGDKEICAVGLERYSWLTESNMLVLLRQFCNGQAALLLENKRKQTNTEKWLWNTVRSAFLKFYSIYPTEARGWLDNLQNTVDAIEKGGGQE